MTPDKEYKALPVNWKEQYHVDDIKDVKDYQYLRGQIFKYFDQMPCIFPNNEERTKWQKEHLKAILLRQKDADWWMPTEHEIIDVDPDTIKEIEREYIICAAIWYKNNIDAPRGFIAQNIDTGVVVGQWRHGNVINTYRQLTGKRTIGEIQGFITSRGNFVDRWQAMCIALHAGQVTPKKAIRSDIKDWNSIMRDRELLESEPCEHRERDTTRYNILFSEDIY